MLPGAKCAPPVTPTPGFAFLSLPAGPLTSSACHPLAPPIVWPSQLTAHVKWPSPRHLCRLSVPGDAQYFLSGGRSQLPSWPFR